MTLMTRRCCLNADAVDGLPLCRCLDAAAFYSVSCLQRHAFSLA